MAVTHAHLEGAQCDKIQLQGGIMTGAKFGKCSMSDEIARQVAEQGAIVIPK
jgi:hypothetical protein